jgi:hypothetical protein
VAVKAPEDLARQFIESAQTRRLQDAVRYIHPSVRSSAHEVVEAYFDNLEERDVLIGYLRRMIDRSACWEDHPIFRDLAGSLLSQYDRISLQDPPRRLVSLRSGHVADLELGSGKLLFPHRAELDGTSWWLKPAPEDTEGYVRHLATYRALLRMQTRYLREISAGIRNGTVNRGNITEHFAKPWY